MGGLTGSAASAYKNIPPATLKVSQAKIRNLNITEGSPSFAFWFAASTYMPILSACVCPLTNMISIAALVTTWRDGPGGVHERDPHSVLALNATSLALGFISNICVVLNFGKRLNYKICQIVSISGFFGASMLLLSGILISEIRYMTEGHQHTEGFWFAVITAVLYMICCISSLLNFLGFLLGKYDAELNLETSERGLIIYTFLLAIWFSWGAASFSNLIEDTSYSNALYFCVESLLTIGLGDVIPVTVAARSLALAYSLTGFIIMGLIIVLIRSTITSKNMPVLFWNLVEIRRKKALEKIMKNDVKLTHRDAFHLMRAVKKAARRYQSNINTVATLIIWIGFWLLGALVFYYAEETWSYFDAVYFCFLCLLTIGYGDVKPTTPAGRCFFVVWAISAVPLMTALISDIGDRLYTLSNREISKSVIVRIFNRRKEAIDQGPLNDLLLNNRDSGKDTDEDETQTVDEILANASKDEQTTRDKDLTKAIDILEKMKQLITESKQNPSKAYDYDYWKAVINLLNVGVEDFDPVGLDDGKFWLSEDSPLSFPVNEPDYLLFLLFSRFENFINKELLKNEDDNTDRKEVDEKTVSSKMLQS